MKSLVVSTYTVILSMAGDITQAKVFLRKECYKKGLCVTVMPTTFLYTGGEEEGFEVGFVNYPRFPSTPDNLYARARNIAEEMLPFMCQLSCLLVAPDKTEWLTLRPEDNVERER